MAYKVFIDGREGTTGLKIHDMLKKRADLEILQIDDEKRKDPAEREKLINSSDVAFLCLPDAAAQEIAPKVKTGVKVIDASTAHRTSPGWAYGFPELSAENRKLIERSDRIANPGCYPTGFISLVYPLVKNGVLPTDYPVVCHAVSGYSGGGKKLITAYQSKERSADYIGVRQYALTQSHKHQKEMQVIAGLKYTPIFNPSVADFYAGMTVSVPLFSRLLKGEPSAKDLHGMLSKYYEGQRFVKVMPLGVEGELEGGFLPSNHLAGTNMLEIYVFGNDERILLASCLDNLGKGASGAAIQCMNIALGLDEGVGL
jgi:N-acetyl-gamma-glutamyl-phosphate reductase